MMPRYRRKGKIKGKLPFAAAIILWMIFLCSCTATTSSEASSDQKDQEAASINSEASAQESLDIALAKRWEDMTVIEQFGSNGFVFHENSYTTCNDHQMDEAYVGAMISTTEAKGFDVYEMDGNGNFKEHTIACELYEINGISEKCALAVKFEGYAETYPFVSWDYAPATLQEFAENLNLKDTLRIVDIWYRNSENNETLHFDLSDDAIVFDLLYQNAPRHEDPEMQLGLIGIDASIEILGNYSVNLWITEDGCLQTNILKSGKSFDLGQEAADAFIEAVLANGEEISQ